jgi:flagellar basal-body rod protein FlgG
MAVQTLYTAATGLDSLQTKLDVIANNLANVNTTSFKKARCNFEDLYYVQDRLPGSRDAAGNLTPTGIAVGLGTRVESTQTDFAQGPFQQTNSQLDIAIEGQGFFQVLDPTGSTFFTRAGNFSVNAQGQFVVGSAYTGRLLQPQISIPPDTTGIVISPDGQVSVRQPNQPNLQTVGQIQLANFVNPEGLLKLGENLYAQTEASGPQNLANPGTLGTGLGVLRQSALEASNVEPVTELIDLITTQRAFELNSQVIQAGDQILQLVANLRRF